jgi:hypothetical protein
MFNWIIGVVIFLFAGWMLYKNIQKSTIHPRVVAVTKRIDCLFLFCVYFFFEVRGDIVEPDTNPSQMEMK